MNDDCSDNNMSTPGPDDVVKISSKVNANEEVEEFDSDNEEEKIDEKKSSSVDYSKHLTYEGDVCIYTEPETNKQMIWDAEKNAWIPRNSEITTPASNDPEFDGENYIYTDKTTNVMYKFDQKKNEWVVKKSDKDKEEGSSIDGESSSGPAVANPGGIYGFENDTHTYTDPNDGTAYFWDHEKSAWFPKVKKIFFLLPFL